MDFDGHSIQVLETVGSGVTGAATIEFADEPPLYHRRPTPSPPLSAALIGSDSLPAKSGSPDALPEALGANWSRLAKTTLDQASFRKLVRISNRLDGWRGKGSRALRPGALRRFLEFWVRVQSAAVPPQFALLPNGHLQALWTSSDRQRMDLEYTETNRVYFGVLNGRRAHEGVETIDIIATLLLAHPSCPLRWSEHEET